MKSIFEKYQNSHVAFFLSLVVGLFPLFGYVMYTTSTDDRYRVTWHGTASGLLLSYFSAPMLLVTYLACVSVYDRLTRQPTDGRRSIKFQLQQVRTRLQIGWVVVITTVAGAAWLLVEALYGPLAFCSVFAVGLTLLLKRGEREVVRLDGERLMLEIDRIESAEREKFAREIEEAASQED